MFSRFKKSSSLLLLAPLLGSPQAEATQVITNADKQSIQVNISVKEANRLAIEGRRIANIVPAQPGLLSMKQDETAGAVFFALTPEATGTVTVFVTDDQAATYRLVLVPRPIGAEEILLQPPTSNRREASADGRASSYQRRIKELILAMVQNSDQGVERVAINKDIPLWQEAKLLLQAKYLEGDLVGERYELTNVSKADMLLLEQELYRRSVRAVSIRDLTLPPGTSTAVYIVRERQEHE